MILELVTSHIEQILLILGSWRLICSETSKYEAPENEAPFKIFWDII